MSAKLPSVGLGLRKGFALAIDETVFFLCTASPGSLAALALTIVRTLPESKDIFRTFKKKLQ